MDPVNVPVLVLREILRHLGVKEKCQLRRVCKYLRELVDSTPQNLILYGRDQLIRGQWPSTNEEIKETEMMKISGQIEANNFSFENPFFRSVRKLLIDQIHFRTLFSSLRYLEQLEVLCLNISNNQKWLEEFTLELSNVKILSVCNSNLTLQAPRLEKLYTRISSHLKLRLKYPETLRFLECYFMKSIPGFVNLEELVCEELDSSFDLNDYPKLKRLNLCPTRRTLPNVKRVIEQKERLGRLDLEILICGFRGSIGTVIRDQILENRYFNLANSAFVVELAPNYSNMVGRFPFQITISHHDLVDHFDPVPGDFFHKFPNIEMVIVDREVDEKHLISFLRRSWTSGLCLETLFSQDLYDQLPLLKAISYLEITKAKKQTNFNFLGNFRNLSTVVLFQSQIPIRAIRRAFENSERFRHFHIYQEDSNTTHEQNQLLLINKYPSIQSRQCSYLLRFNMGERRSYIFSSLNEVIRCIREDEQIRYFRLNEFD